ncbi:hypothetical protein HYT56_00540 [Candidatus Woesearchaeota archaeon]|nr:hypothetical protein [Candidatus Woesearchaeota archaeon]
MAFQLTINTFCVKKVGEGEIMAKGKQTKKDYDDDDDFEDSSDEDDDWD